MKDGKRNQFYIRTFGCQMNVLDSEKVAGALTAAGWEMTEEPGEAGLVLFNTCSVREKAATRVYAHLGQMAALKKKNPRLVVAVMGCVAQQEGEALLRAVRGLDLVVGTRQEHLLPGLVEEIRRQPGRRLVRVEMDEDPLPVEAEQVLRESPFRAFVTIMEGCDNYCAYCVVPHTRGRERSRPANLIQEEIRSLVDRGVLEVMLLGQNVNSYRDPSARRLDFTALLDQIAKESGLRRLRFTTSHPKDFTRELLSVMVENPVICNQLHLPAQSGSTVVLQRMNRRYGREEYLEKTGWIRSAPRSFSLSSDFIVGFPGETGRDFEETMSLLEIVRYDSIFSFMYSPRPGTAALNYPDEVPAAVKGERLRILQALQEKIQLENNSAEIGRCRDVLVDGPGRLPGQLASRTAENKIVHFNGEAAWMGTFRKIRITGASSHTLQGEDLGPDTFSSAPPSAV